METLQTRGSEVSPQADLVRLSEGVSFDPVVSSTFMTKRRPSVDWTEKLQRGSEEGLTVSK